MILPMPTIPTDIEGFKQMSAEFVRNLDNIKTREQLDNGLKCLGIAYAGLEGGDAVAFQAQMILEFVTERVSKRELLLIRDEMSKR